MRIRCGNLLTGADVEVYVPRESRVKVVSGKAISGDYALMPGYALVRIVPSAAAFSALKGMKNVIDIVGTGQAGYVVCSRRGC